MWVQDNRPDLQKNKFESPRKSLWTKHTHVLQATVGTKNIEVPGRKVNCEDTTRRSFDVRNGEEFTTASQFTCLKMKREPANTFRIRARDYRDE